MKLKKKNRDFAFGSFEDKYGNECSLQKSSLATEDCIWLGLDRAKPLILASKAKENGIETDQAVGWIPFPIPSDVLIGTRMHLTRDMVRDILPMLNRFVETGELYE